MAEAVATDSEAGAPERSKAGTCRQRFGTLAVCDGRGTLSGIGRGDSAGPLPIGGGACPLGGFACVVTNAMGALGAFR